MKIVSVLTSDSEGGAEFAAVELLDALHHRGHDTVLLTNQPRLARDTAVAAREIALGPKLSSRTYPSLALTAPARLWQLWAGLARERPYDVLLVHFKKEQLLAAALPRSLRSTLVWAEWGPVPFQMRSGVTRRAYLWAGGRAALIMAVSEGTRTSLRDVGLPDRKLHVVPNAVRTDVVCFRPEGRARVRAELEIPDAAFVVGVLSRLHPKKRNDVVIDAVAELPDVHLILAGEGEAEAELRARARPLGARMHFIPTPRPGVEDVLSAFDVSVFCPSPTEGSPLAVTLAMLAERPVLATGAEGVADMIAPDVGGISSPENDPDALAALLRRYVGDPERIAAQGSEARRRAVATHSAPVVAERVERLIGDPGRSQRSPA